MEPIRESFQSGALLSKAMDDLNKSLSAPFDPQPVDPRLGFFNAALSVLFFSRCVLIEMIERDSFDLSGTNAIRFAIFVADYPSAAKLLQTEIQEISDEDPDYLSGFFAEIREMMEERKFGPDWLTLIET
mgnify:CR=1 FL=1